MALPLPVTLSPIQTPPSRPTEARALTERDTEREWFDSRYMWGVIENGVLHYADMEAYAWHERRDPFNFTVIDRQF